MLSRLTSHFGGGNAAPGGANNHVSNHMTNSIGTNESADQNNNNRREPNQSSQLTSLPMMIPSRDISPLQHLQQDTDPYLNGNSQFTVHKSSLKQQDKPHQNQKLLSTKFQASLVRDNSEPKLIMPDIYVSPNQASLRKQSATLTDAIPMFTQRKQKKSSVAGSIFSLRDQVKVCDIINKRFKKRAIHRNKTVDNSKNDGEYHEHAKKRNEESTHQEKENRRSTNAITSKQSQRGSKFPSKRRSQEPVSSGVRQTILEIGSQAVESDKKQQAGMTIRDQQDQSTNHVIGFEPEELLQERLNMNTTRHASVKGGKKLIFDSPKSPPSKFSKQLSAAQAHPNHFTTANFNKDKDRNATTVINTSTAESFNANIYYQTNNKERSGVGERYPSRIKIGGAVQFNDTVAGFANNNQRFVIPGFTETLTTSGPLNQLSAGADTSPRHTNNHRMTPERNRGIPKIPSRKDFIRAIEGTNSVNELVTEVKNRFELKRQVREEQNAKRMKGNTGAFQLPDETFYKRNLSKNNNLKNINYVEQVSNNVVHMQGMIYVNDYYAQQKNKRNAKLDPLKDYVKNFSQLHEVIDSEAVQEESNVFGFAKALQNKLQTNKIKVDLKHGLFNKMSNIKTSRQVAHGEITEEQATKQKEDLKPETMMFNKTIEEETKTISNIARNFVRMNEYVQKYKKRELSTDRHGQLYDLDPRIKYFKQCLREQDLVLPILDKIYKKTLCLNDYNLSDGNCTGLAAACELFDHQIVNRVLFNNCGITGDQFAMILEGLHKLHDFKSIIYKMNTINANSLTKMVPVFEKRLPNHLEELKIIDCKVNSSLISQLMRSLIEKSQLRSLALVNIHHSPESFELVTQYVQESEYLREIDLGWSIIMPSYWLSFMDVVSKNRTLTSLTLSFCQILEDQNYKLTQEERWQGVEEVELSQWNMKVMGKFKDFVKYNPNLIHLDLQNTGLMSPAIRQIGELLSRAQSLKCLHLCGNDGVTESTIEWLQKRIRGKAPKIANNIIPYKQIKNEQSQRQKQIDLQSTAADSNKKQDVFKLFGVQQKNNSNNDSRNDNQESGVTNIGAQFKSVDPKAQWKDIRQGLKLRNIVQTKRMNELGLKSGIKESKLVLQRHLGYKTMIPGSGQWQLLTDRKDECWHCGQHILTLFIWTPRIGQLTSNKDPKIIKHYRDQMEAVNADDDFMPTFYSTPRIASQFNGWHYKDMREIIPFCEDYCEENGDHPDFLQLCLSEGKIKELDVELQDQYEKKKLKVAKAVEERKQQFYRENWSKIIMRILRFKNPLVANAHMLTNITNEIDPNQKIYFHIDWLKPGKHTFVIQHDNDDIKLGDEYEAEEEQKKPTSIASLFGLKGSAATKKQSEPKTVLPKLKSLKKSTSSFYVHEMLATFRSDPIPPFFKERHVHNVERNKHKGKMIFKSVTQEVLDNMRGSLEKDFSWCEIKEITNDDLHEEKILMKHTQINYEMISETYHWLQSRSKLYPWIDDYTFREAFIKQLNILDAKTFNMSKFEVLMKQAKFANRFDNRIDKRYVDVPNGICRFMFIELLFRIAKFLYSSNENETMAEVSRMKLAHNAENETVQVSTAFYMLIKDKLVPFYKKNKISQHAFREDKLHQPDVEVVYTMNEQALRKIYLKKSLEGRDTKLKPHNADWMIMQDCHTLFREDISLKLPYKMINEAFGMSQIHMVNEFDRHSVQDYNKLTYLEFLEFLARISELYFENSEMEDLDLHVKIEYLLDELLPLVSAKRVKQTTVIEEFSESDDDY